MTVYLHIQINFEKPGEVTYNDLQDYLKVSNNAFTRRVLQIFDEDGSGHVNFGDFIVSLWNYCILDHATLIIFAFDLYDTGSKGVLKLPDVNGMLSGESFLPKRNKSIPFTANLVFLFSSWK